MGLDIYLRWNGQTKDEEKAQYTGFRTTGKAGYLRSAYNDGGFNAWARRHLGKEGFYHIFAYDEDAERPTGAASEDGEDGIDKGFFPDWDACEERTRQMLEEARKLDNHTVVRCHLAPTVHKDQNEVLNAFRAEAERNKGDVAAVAFGGWFSNRLGDFFFREPPTVKAVMWAKGFDGNPEAMLVVESPDVHKYYIESLEQTLEFIKLGREKLGWLVWSA